MFMRTLHLLIAAGLAVPAFPQGLEKLPLKGFFPSSTFEISDIETVSTSNGGLVLHIPIVSMPPTRGGFAAGVSLVYNSKQWQAAGTLKTISKQSGGGCQDISGTYYTLNPVDGGAWRYGIQYRIRVTEKKQAIYNDTQNNCPSLSGPTECQGVGNYYNWKFEMEFPDGSLHTLIPQRGEQPSTDGSGYYNVDSTGQAWACNATHSAPQAASVGSLGPPMTLYTNDGTYVRVKLNDDANWTMSFPDGRTVSTRTSCGQSEATCRVGQTLSDKNGHWNNIVVDTSGPHTIYTITDEFSRQITVVTGGGTDTITAKGPNSNDLTWSVNWTTIASALSYRHYDSSYDPAVLGSVPDSPMPSLTQVSSITLPTAQDSLQYLFEYGTVGANGLTRSGELNKITLPSGAVADYTYLLDTALPSTLIYQNILDNTIATKKLSYTTAHEGGVSIPTADKWEYNIVPSSSILRTLKAPDGGITYVCDAGTVFRQLNPDGTLIERVWAGNPPTKATQPTSGAGSEQNTMPIREYRTALYPISGGVTAALCGTDPMSGLVQTDAHAYQNNGLTAITTSTYDKNGNLLQTIENGFIAFSSIQRDTDGQPKASQTGLTPIRTTTNTYYPVSSTAPNYSNDTTCGTGLYCDGANTPTISALKSTVFNSVKAQTVQGTGPGRRTDYCYDNELLGANVTLAASGPYGTTAIVSCTSGRSSLVSGAVAVSHSYDANANLTETRDGRNNATTFDYTFDSTKCSTNFSDGLYLTKTTDPLSHSTWQCYDANTGLVTKVSDNNEISTTTTYDNIGRPKIVTRASGIQAARTQFTYSDANRYVVTQSDLAGADLKLTSIQRFDAGGRLRLEQHMEDGPPASFTTENVGIRIQHRYITGTGQRFSQVSNPYRDLADATMGWTQSTTDIGGRTTDVRSIDGSATNGIVTGRTTTTYGVGSGNGGRSGQIVTIAEVGGASRTQIFDALGRLTEVDEGCANCVTTYDYNGTGELNQVNQGAQIRTFGYDFRGLLTSASNPESGTIGYEYDENGNLKRKTDPRPNARIDFTYDAANRLTLKTYTGVGGNSQVQYQYDGSGAGCTAGSTYPTGRLSVVTATLPTTPPTLFKTTYDCYDALGRITQSRQTTGQEYKFAGSSGESGYMYNLAGGLTQLRYPSGHIVTTTYDNAGRATGVASATQAYASDVSYAPHGAMQHLTMGNTLVEHSCYNSRLQLSGRRVGTNTATNCNWATSDLLQLIFDYGSTSNINNGNLRNQWIKVPWASDSTQQLTIQQTYTYDGVNRLASVGESAAGLPTGVNSGSWSQPFNYDRYGNLWADPPGSMGATMPKSQDHINAANNRLLKRPDGTALPTDAYDAAGNLQKHPDMGDMVYDGENRLIQFTNGGHVYTYDYDGEGHRVRKTLSSAGVVTSTTVYVYDAMGQLAAEYPSGGNPDSGEQYLTTDNLGSTRLITDDSHRVVQRLDYFPFGQTIPSEAGYANRNLVAGYAAPSNVTQEFTGKERDAETGLDYFGARYFSGPQGKWTSADKPFADQHPFDPQSWNLYAYVRNNPARLVDDDGEGAKEKLAGAWQGAKNFANNTMIGFIAFSTDPVGTISGLGSDLKEGARLWLTSSGRKELSEAWNSLSEEEKVAFVTETALEATTAAAGVHGAMAEAPPLEVTTVGRIEPAPGTVLNVPNDYWTQRKAPTQVTPGTRQVTEAKPSSQARGETYNRTSHYDEYGRMTGQTHETTHGRSSAHPNPHHHVYDPRRNVGPVKPKVRPGVHPDYKPPVNQ